MAYSMVAIHGMNDKIGNVSFYGLSQDQFQKPFSDNTATLIDEEVRKLLTIEYKRAQELLKKYLKELKLLANELLEKEVLLKSDVIKLIGPRPFTSKKEAEPEVTDSISDNGLEEDSVPDVEPESDQVPE
jgi:cell division protease FtsH